MLSYLTAPHGADPDIDPTDDFKRIQIKPFEKYMNSALEPLADSTRSMIDDIS